MKKKLSATNAFLHRRNICNVHSLEFFVLWNIKCWNKWI